MASDVASALIPNGVRLYDPRLGRFTGVDPVEGGSCNDYEYVCGDPIDLTDVTGRDMSFDQFYARPASVAEFFGNNWVDQIYENRIKIAVYITQKINHDFGINPETGTTYVVEMARVIERRTEPPRARCLGARNSSGGCMGSGVARNVGVGAAVGCAAGGIRGGVQGGIGGGPPAAAAGAAGGCGWGGVEGAIGGVIVSLPW